MQKERSDICYDKNASSFSFPLSDAVMSQVKRKGNCLVWTGPLNNKGYGQIYLDGRTRVVHRVVYEAVMGRIPEGMELDHLCRNPPCVFPSHLEPVTHRENIRRGKNRGSRFGAAAINANKDTCKRGHAFSVLTVWGGRSRRVCYVCRNGRERLARRRMKLRKDVKAVVKLDDIVRMHSVKLGSDNAPSSQSDDSRTGEVK